MRTSKPLFLVLVLLWGVISLVGCRAGSDDQSDGLPYLEQARATKEALDDMETIIIPLVNEASVAPSVTQTKPWSDAFLAQVVRAEELLGNWSNLTPPENGTTYHNAMAAYLTNVARQYRLLHEGLASGNRSVLTEALALREQSRSLLSALDDSLGIQPSPANPTDTFWASSRSLAGALREMEVEFSRLIGEANANILPPTWGTDMRVVVNRLESIEGDWQMLRPPPDWVRYHGAMAEYIGLMKGAVQAAMDGVLGQSDTRLNEADALLDAVEAKRLEIVSIVSQQNLTP